MTRQLMPKAQGLRHANQRQQLCLLDAFSSSLGSNDHSKSTPLIKFMADRFLLTFTSQMAF